MDNFGMNVVFKHRYFGVVTLNNVTEVHWGYPLLGGVARNRVAFESDLHGTGATYEIADILEMEVFAAGDLAPTF